MNGRVGARSSPTGGAGGDDDRGRRSGARRGGGHARRTRRRLRRALRLRGAGGVGLGRAATRSEGGGAGLRWSARPSAPARCAQRGAGVVVHRGAMRRSATEYADAPSLRESSFSVPPEKGCAAEPASRHLCFSSCAAFWALTCSASASAIFSAWSRNGAIVMVRNSRAAAPPIGLPSSPIVPAVGNSRWRRGAPQANCAAAASIFLSVRC